VFSFIKLLIAELFTTDWVARIAILLVLENFSMFFNGGKTLITFFGILFLSSNEGVFDASTIIFGLNSILIFSN